jgi:hypothetical protein
MRSPEFERRGSFAPALAERARLVRFSRYLFTDP